MCSDYNNYDCSYMYRESLFCISQCEYAVIVECMMILNDRQILFLIKPGNIL